MILTDREIKNSLSAGLLDITPRPAQDAYASTSVDLTLASGLRIFKKPWTQFGICDQNRSAVESFSPFEIGRSHSQSCAEWRFF